jgi:hypothetical protein
LRQIKIYRRAWAYGPDMAGPPEGRTARPGEGTRRAREETAMMSPAPAVCFDPRRILVTGAWRGIGSAVAWVVRIALPVAGGLTGE